eukprot:Gb_33562 [translate_table: standard]
MLASPDISLPVSVLQVIALKGPFIPRYELRRALPLEVPTRFSFGEAIGPPLTCNLDAFVGSPIDLLLVTIGNEYLFISFLQIHNLLKGLDPIGSLLKILPWGMIKEGGNMEEEQGMEDSAFSFNVDFKSISRGW